MSESLGGGAGARRARAVGRRPHTIWVRVSEEEHRWLALRAAAAGLTVPRLLMESVQAASTGETISERRTMLMELVGVRRLLANVANNLNQVAKAANSGVSVPAAQLDAELVSLRKLGERILSVVEQLMPR